MKESLLAGISGDYNGLVAVVNANHANTSADVCNQLLAFDYRQKMLSESEESATLFTSSANAATHRGGGSGGYRPIHGGGSGYLHHVGGGHGGGGGSYHNQQQGRPPRRMDCQDAGCRPQAQGGRGRGRGNRVPSPHQYVMVPFCAAFMALSVSVRFLVFVFLVATILLPPWRREKPHVAGRPAHQSPTPWTHTWNVNQALAARYATPQR